MRNTTGKNATYIAADPPLALVYFIHSTKMLTNADLVATAVKSSMRDVRHLKRRALLQQICTRGIAQVSTGF